MCGPRIGKERLVLGDDVGGGEGGVVWSKESGHFYRKISITLRNREMGPRLRCHRLKSGSGLHLGPWVGIEHKN